MITESCCQFGASRHLAGIITDPGTGRARAAVVLVNAGLSPKCGPFRLYTELARRLASEGVLVLRFDLGGLGESQQPVSEAPLRRRTQEDLRAAVDYLEDRQALDEVILGGLCSGAEDAFRYAEKDPRVTGLVLIDPFAYRTAGWQWRNLVTVSAKRVLGALRLYRRRPLTNGGASGEAAAKALVEYRYLEPAESRRILGALLGRRAQILFLYTGGMSEYFNHPGQLAAMFRGIALGDRVTVDHLPRLGHTQLLAADRGMLIDAIARRLAGRRPVSSHARVARSC
jgi:pimeloyl-ACP methyl ester carboxylesterase